MHDQVRLIGHYLVYTDSDEAWSENPTTPFDREDFDIWTFKTVFNQDRQ